MAYPEWLGPPLKQAVGLTNNINEQAATEHIVHSVHVG